MKIVHTFSQGDRVPDWLITMDPREPTAIPASLTFNCPGVVLEGKDGYLIVPDSAEKVALLQFIGGQGLDIRAGSLTVSIAPVLFVLWGSNHQGRGGTLIA